MTSATYKVIVLVLAIFQLVAASLVDRSAIFGFGPVAVTTLGIISACLTLVANYLPSLFGAEPPVKSKPPV